MITQVALSLDERLRVAHAACNYLAQRSGADLLSVKGVAAMAQFPSRTNVGTDVDVIVRPRHVGRFVQALEEAGWVLMRESSELDLSSHAIVLEHPLFACSVDVHRYFPGFTADPDAVFSDLWADRVPVVIAGVTCWVPDAVHHGAVLIVNAARTRGSEEATRVWTGWGDRERSAARSFISEFGGQAPAATQLPGEFDLTRSYYWQVVADHPTGAAMWLARLWETPGIATRLRLLAHALVPPPRWGRRETPLQRAARVPRHWAKGLSQLPGALRRINRMRRG